MKFQPTWQHVALIAVLLSAVIAAHAFAPAASTSIDSIVATIVGMLAMHIRSLRSEQAKAEDEAKPAAVLSIVPEPKGDA
jgi:hypothetical protein